MQNQRNNSIAITGLSTALAIMASTALVSPAAAQQNGMNTTNLEATIHLEGLDDPWDMAFLDDGTMFFTEKCQGLSVMMPSGEVMPLLGMPEAEGYPQTADDLFCEGQAGDERRRHCP